MGEILWDSRLFLFPFGGFMRKLMLLLIAFIAVVTFIRAFDKGNSGDLSLQGSRQSSVEAPMEANFNN
jgi:hypothetical protein